MKTPFLQIENIHKSFEGHKVLDGINLTIEKGELFSLLGGSGCGKTTLLRILAGFEQPDHGRILLEGQDITHMQPYIRPFNMVFQSYALFPHLTVEQNIAFGLKQDKVPTKEIKERVQEILELVQLQDFSKRKPHQLSGGQRQRVALARSLVKRPKILLLDEPLGALDKKLREETQFELIELQKRIGVTFVMVTHDQDEAMSMSQRLAILHQGHVMQVGTPREIYENPENRFTAEFIGSINLFDGNVKSVNGQFAWLHSLHLNKEFQVETSSPLSQGQEISLAIRPEKIQIKRKVNGINGENASGTVRSKTYFGDFSVFHIDMDNGGKVQVRSLNHAFGFDDISEDDQVCLYWEDKNNILLTN